jgi:hypothetical protein
MAKANFKLNTNGRVVSEFLTNYRDTFRAFTELINNSLQAGATEIRLNLIHSKTGSMLFPGITSIELRDNGHGIAHGDLEKTVFEVGTTIKPGGSGIGRFSALQIGETMRIETVGFDRDLAKYTRFSADITASALKNHNLDDIDFASEKEVLKKDTNTYYKVTISNLYQYRGTTVAKHNRLSDAFLESNLPGALAQYYIYEIFNDVVKFYINDQPVDRQQFVIDQPVLINKDFTALNGKVHPVVFKLYHIISDLNKVKLFTLVDNAGMKSVANEYTYSSDYYTPELGTWFIYIETDLFSADLFRNTLLEAFGDEELYNLKSFIRTVLNEFFKERNTSFRDFVEKLKVDKANPLLQNKPVSETHELIFNKIAYLVETNYQMLEKGDKIKDLVYDLIDKSIKNGKVSDLFAKLTKMKETTLNKFHNLVETTDLESVVHFSAQVAEKIEFLNFLHDITYGPVSKVLKERSQLHKIVEKQLWLFGESYAQTPHLWSDKRIGGIFDAIRDQTLAYEPTDDDGNLVKSDEEEFNDITDLFFYNEKITGDDVKEYMVVELKAPKCKISQKELNQIDRYAFEIESAAGLPTEKTRYKLILISSDMTAFAKSKLKSARETYNQPFLVDRKTEKNIEVFVMTWSELMEINKRKLNYLSSELEVRDKDVSQKFEEEYPQLLNDKVTSQLRLIQAKAV